MSETKKNALPKREEIEERYKWKLEDIYSDNTKWEADYNKVKELSSLVKSFKGTLSNSDEVILKCFSSRDELLSLTDRVFVYARMRQDENNSNPVYQSFAGRAFALSSEVLAAISFIEPELLTIPEEKLKDFISKNDGLKIYSQYFNEILRQKKHTLSEREEEILAMSSEVAHVPSDVFKMLNNADIKFPFIRDENGEEVEVTKGRYVKLMESKDRRVRKDAFTALYSSYGKSINTLASCLTGNVKKNCFIKKVRGYNSCLEASLDADNVSATVYDSLIDTINKNIHLLHRYLRLRKKVLKLDELHMYDLYVPIVNEPPKAITYSDAVKMVKEGLLPLGEEYGKCLSEGLDSGWVDVFENEGKTSGAYSWGSFLTHPYVLLNYQGTINDAFTIAHEMGHALHSYYTNKTQPYIYSEYKIFVAEVASNVNEALLMRHLLKTSESPQEKAYILNHYLEEFRGSVYRQVMFAEFEKEIHMRTEKGESLNASSLNEIYKKLNSKYFGSEVVIDDEIAAEWSRIPHFYTSFYVYKYATGLSAASSIANSILNEGTPAVERYKNFLKSGSSDYPLELLKKTGVDLTTPKPVEDALLMFEQAIDQLEKLL
ncbi:MAG TPA: oligoendopeptidase F [Clostridia bacterium]